METVPNGSTPVLETEPAQGRTFSTRAEFLAAREDVLAAVLDRLDGDVSMGVRDELLAECYVTSLETRLTLAELDVALSAFGAFMETGPGKFFGKVPKTRGRKGDNDGQG
jgi:hypothetical protein